MQRRRHGVQTDVVAEPRGVEAHNSITLTTTAETTLLAAGGAGVFLDLCFLLISNTSATAVRIDFRDATAGTVRFSVVAPASTVKPIVIPFALPWEQTTANANWTAQLAAAVTDVRIAAQAIRSRDA